LHSFTRRMKRLYAISFFAVTITAFAISAIQSSLEENRELKESEMRAVSLLTRIEQYVHTLYVRKRHAKIAQLANRLKKHERITGIALCIDSNRGQRRGRLYGFSKDLNLSQVCSSVSSASILQSSGERKNTRPITAKLKLGAKQLYLYGVSTRNTALTLVIGQDLTYLRQKWIGAFLQALLLTWSAGMALLILITAQARSWIKINLRFMQHTLRALTMGRKPSPKYSEELTQGLSKKDDLIPISNDIDKLAAKIHTLRSGSKSKEHEHSWLNSLRKTIGNRQVVVIANREPYIHQRVNGKIDMIRPASGLVTALEPILRQCGGLWIAHGSGSADRETTDAKGEIAVPPFQPKYKLKRIWLSQEEEEGYYYGFANEGLWPLCHLAHNRPVFRLSDWRQYCKVNKRFCDETPESVLNEQSLILVQDYHFALLPRMLKQRTTAMGKDAERSPKIGIFWHIPWPNPETFGISPWYKDLLGGMLGADVIGFHTQYHCNNFLETCDRYLEARIDWENFAVNMEKHETLIRAFPIGIDTAPVRALTDEERAELRAHYGIKGDIVAVGVDRLDYTKGIVERVNAVERFLEKHPEYVGRFTLAQMGSPSRTHIAAYRTLTEDLENAVNRINMRFKDPRQKDGYQPIRLLAHHHDWDEIQYFYQLGDICMVTSLHDGMNLVAKEYVWCQRPDRGSLILSKFAGASRELTDAVIVNPYSIEEMADAIATAIALPAEERFRRMKAMRDKIENHNAFHWASDLIHALAHDVRRPLRAHEPLRAAFKSLL
jgi:trehalose-6-phosphate synthase